MNSISEIIKSNIPTLVDFSAEWCAPCKMMKPVLKSLKTKMGDKLNVEIIDIDKDKPTHEAYGVRDLPTLILFKNGEIKWQHSGGLDLKTMMQVVEQYGG